MRELVDAVRMILHRRGITYDMLAGDELRIDHGSAEVWLALSTGPMGSVITLSADVLSDCEIEPAAELRVLRSLNERNRTLRFGRFFLDESRRTVVLRYDILAEDLQDSELLNGLIAVARTADDHDDLLQREFGTGLRASDRSGRDTVAQAF